MATAQQWIGGARPRTLPTAIAPVVVGTAAARAAGSMNLGHAVLALLVALLLQIGVNYANDYSDGIRGTDEVRVGPIRLVGQRLAEPAQVKFAAFACFGLAMLAGLVLVALVQAWWMLLVGVACVWAAWKYTGGKHPYGYYGLGEVFVFVFFGLVATAGTTYTQSGSTGWTTWLGATGVGAIACAILVANNLRDIPGDIEAGKHTLAVRLGDARTRHFYLALLAVAALVAIALVPWHPFAPLALLGLAPAARHVRDVLRGARGRDLIPVLSGTGITSLTYGIALAVGIWLH